VATGFATVVKQSSNSLEFIALGISNTVVRLAPQRTLNAIATGIASVTYYIFVFTGFVAAGGKALEAWFGETREQWKGSSVVQFFGRVVDYVKRD
jgi:hypothetical protein